MTSTVRRSLALVAVVALIGVACTGDGGSTTSSSNPSASHEPVTITVWDYYGTATPFSKEVIQTFEDQYPWITVDHQAVGYEATHDKFTVSVSGGAPPDLATVDMTWIPTFASNGLFANVSELSGGQINGTPIEQTYSQGALDAMTFDGNIVTAMFDFDAYALYYRADQFKQKGIDVPTTWDEMKAAAAKLAEDTDGDGTCDKFCFEIYGNDCFHWCQFLFQSGGSILSPDSTAAAFDDDAGLSALEYYKSFLDDGTGIYWGTDEGDPTAGIKDERIGMFQDGPYWMGLMKDGIPEQSGDWAVATAPYSEEPGSYLGGTGLSIPVNAEHPQEAWLFAQYMLQLPQQLLLFKLAGAAPATADALSSPQLTKPDPYFGGQAPFPIFQDAMETATHFPYVKEWDPIDSDIGNMVEGVMLGRSTPQEGLSQGAQEVNAELQG
jgi:ABC-type glycerol-3-phosphate transport system substrate-binding protein